MPQLVITAVGPDRPGLTSEFTAPIFEAGANVADSRMINLRGHFALLLLVDGSDSALAQAKQKLGDAAARIGLTASFAAQPPSAQAREGVPYRLKTYSLDQPGIVHRVTALLKQHAINIEELETRLDSGPFMGSPLFTMELTMTVPRGVRVTALRRELEALADTLNCDVDLEPA